MQAQAHRGDVADASAGAPESLAGDAGPATQSPQRQSPSCRRPSVSEAAGQSCFATANSLASTGVALSPIAPRGTPRRPRPLMGQLRRRRWQPRPPPENDEEVLSEEAIWRRAQLQLQGQVDLVGKSWRRALSGPPAPPRKRMAAPATDAAETADEGGDPGDERLKFITAGGSSGSHASHACGGADASIPSTGERKMPPELERLDEKTREAVLRIARFEAEVWLREERQRHAQMEAETKRWALQERRLAQWHAERSRVAEEELRRREEEQEVKAERQQAERKRWKRRDVLLKKQCADWATERDRLEEQSRKAAEEAAQAEARRREDFKKHHARQKVKMAEYSRRRAEQEAVEATGPACPAEKPRVSQPIPQPPWSDRW